MAKQAIIISDELDLDDNAQAQLALSVSYRALLSKNKSDDKFKLEVELDPYYCGWVNSGTPITFSLNKIPESLGDLEKELKKKRIPLFKLELNSNGDEGNSVKALAIGPAADGKVDHIMEEFFNTNEDGEDESTNDLDTYIDDREKAEPGFKELVDAAEQRALETKNENKFA